MLISETNSETAMTAPSHDLVAHAPTAVPHHHQLVQDHAAHAAAGHGPAELFPGLLLAAAIAGAGFGLRQFPGLAVFSPMILAVLIGMAFHNVIGTPRRAKAGVTFSLRRVLRFAIVLLGMQLTASQVVEVGARGLAVIALSLTGTFLFTVWMGLSLIHI